MKVINDKKRLLFTLKEKTSGPLVVAPEELILVEESLKQATGGVQSVTGDSVDNTDPQNPIINAIPLTGTEEGSPVTGPIEITHIGFAIANKNQVLPIAAVNDDGSRVSYFVTNRPQQIIQHPTIGKIAFKNRGTGFFFIDELNNRIEFQIGTNQNIFTKYDGTEKE